MANKKKKTSTQKKQPKFNGHFCKICGEHKANEKFSGKGHANHICKTCASKSPEERSEDQTINKLHNMAFRFINESEKKWLYNRRKDKREEVKKLAEEIFQMKFPRQARNEIKKTLHIDEITFYVNGEIYDEYGDETFVNVKFIADCSGKIVRQSYDDSNKVIEEKTINIDKKAIRKFFNVVVHNYEISFWEQDLCLEISDDPDIDLLPEFYDEYDDEFDFDDEDDDYNDDEEIVEEIDDRVPSWQVDIDFINKTKQNTKGYDYIPDQVLEMYLDFVNYFEDETFDEDDFEEDYSDNDLEE